MDYSKAKIYKIYNNIDDEIYVGSTCSSLSVRMARHRYSVNENKNKNGYLYQKMREIGMNNFFIELLQDYPDCQNIEQLRRKEGEFIRELKPTLNRNIAGRTTKERYNDNIEDKKQYDKDRWIINKAKYSIMMKEYYQEKKHLLCQKVECDCGSIVCKNHFKRHLTSIKHLEWAHS